MFDATSDTWKKKYAELGVTELPLKRISSMSARVREVKTPKLVFMSTLPRRRNASASAG